MGYTAGRITLVTAAALLLGLAAGVRAEVVVVVSAQNPNDALSRTELVDIYLGRRNRFPNGDPAIPLDHREGSASHASFYRLYLDQTPAQIKAHWSRLIFTGRGQPPRTVSSPDAMVELVANNPRAIGYMDASLVDDRVRVLSVE